MMVKSYLSAQESSWNTGTTIWVLLIGLEALCTWGVNIARESSRGYFCQPSSQINGAVWKGSGVQRQVVLQPRDSPLASGFQTSLHQHISEEPGHGVDGGGPARRGSPSAARSLGSETCQGPPSN